MESQRKVSARLAQKRTMMKESNEITTNSAQSDSDSDFCHSAGYGTGTKPPVTMKGKTHKIANNNLKYELSESKKGIGKKSRKFLDFLELKPVDAEPNYETAESQTTSSISNENGAQKDLYSHKINTNSDSFTSKVGDSAKDVMCDSITLKSPNYDQDNKLNDNGDSCHPSNCSAHKMTHQAEEQEKRSDSMKNSEATTVQNIYIVSKQGLQPVNNDGALAVNADVDTNKNKAKDDGQSTQDSSNLLSTSSAGNVSKKDVQHETEKNEIPVQNTDNSKKVFIFRDKYRTLTFINGTPQDKNKELFPSLETNRKIRKRRYVKLMQQLEVTSKSLESNLKQIDLLPSEVGETDDGSLDSNFEQLKKKKYVRDKKKYEFLINYQKDQSIVDQKSFSDVLPEKVEKVTADIFKQLDVDTQPRKSMKRRRGRPKKPSQVQKDKNPSETPAHRKTTSQGIPSKPRGRKREPSSAGFPRKFPKSLLQGKASAATARQQQASTLLKLEKIRLGIIDKYGGKEVIELSNDTLKGLEPLRSSKADSPAVALNVANVGTTDSGILNGSTNLELGETDSLIKESEKEETWKNNQLSSGGSETVQELPRTSALGINPTASDNWKTSEPLTISLPSVSAIEKDYELVSLTTVVSAGKLSGVGDVKKDQFFIPQSSFHQDGKTGMIIVGPFCISYDSPKPSLVLVPPDKREMTRPMILMNKLPSNHSTPPRDFRITKSKRHRDQRELKSLIRPKLGTPGDSEIVLLDHDYATPVAMRENLRKYVKGVAKYTANAKFIDARVEEIVPGTINSLVTIRGSNMLRHVQNLPNPSAAPVLETKDGIPLVYNLSQIMTPVLQWAENKAKRDQMAEESRRTGDFTHVFVPYSAMGTVVMEVLIPPGGTEYTLRIPSGPMGYSVRSKRKRDRLFMCNPSETPWISAEAEGSKSDVLEGNAKEIVSLKKESSSTENRSNQSSNKAQSAVSEPRNEEGKDEDFVRIENEAAVTSTPEAGLACCHVCLRLFPSTGSLLAHVRGTHPASREETMACPLCVDPPLNLANPRKLRGHLLKQHGIKDTWASCRICRLDCVSHRRLRTHMEMMHGITTQRRGRLLDRKSSYFSDYITCGKCNVAFGDRTSLVSHTLNFHPELNQPTSCRLCDREFESEIALRKHLRNVHDQSRNGALRCPFCPTWLSNMEAAFMHKNSVHNSSVPVHCPFCAAGYQSLHLMYNHIRTQHLQTEVHVCPQCQTGFPTARLLSQHAWKEHLISPHVIKEHLHSSQGHASNNSYCCPFCSVAVPRTYDLAIHVVTAHRSMLLPASCHFCAQAFVNTQVMNVHMSAAHGFTITEEGDGQEADTSYLSQQYGEEGGVVGGEMEGEEMEDDMEEEEEEEEEEELYSGEESLRCQRKGAVSEMRHVVTGDMMDSQEAANYMNGLEGSPADTIVYLDSHHQVVNLPVGHDSATGAMFDECSAMEEVLGDWTRVRKGVHEEVLGNAVHDLNLQSVDYLETVSNDSIAVAVDVIADVKDDFSDRASGLTTHGVGGVTPSEQDMLRCQFEVDGVLYQLIGSHDQEGGQIHAVSEENALNADQLAHLLPQDVP